MADVLNPPCVGRTIKVDSACGCTLTRPTITGLSPSDIVDLGFKEIYLTRAILDAAEAKMLGVPERSLMTLLNSTIKDVKGKLMIDKVDEQSIVMPFIQRTQRGYINANYWTILAGTPPADAGTGDIPASAWNFTLGLGNSTFQTDLDAIERYFVPGSTLIVKTWDNVATKTALTNVYTVIRAVNSDAGATKKAIVTVYPNVSAANWAALSPTEKANYHPVFGMAENGANSISDYESYCQNQPSDLNRRIIVNWLQTTRQSYCREQAYEEVLDQILKGNVNDYLKGFKFQSIAEQQKQMRARYDLAAMNSAFFGQAIDVDNQTTANWRNLPKVYDLVSTDCPLAYKASALGIFTLLVDCNRVIDMQGNRLDLDDIFSRIYLLRRFREATGDRVPVIDSMTDRYTASYIFETMTKYYTAKYGVNITKFFQANQKITHDNWVLFTYDIYDVKEAGCQWAVFVDDYFNDLVDAFGTQWVGWDAGTRANNLWFLDWSDISKGVSGSKSKDNQTPRDNTDLALWQCVITPNVRKYQLKSETWTVMVDRPERHLIIHNFASGCPRVTIPGCTVPQS
jgi:hypothetical protein